MEEFAMEDTNFCIVGSGSEYIINYIPVGIVIVQKFLRILKFSKKWLLEFPRPFPYSIFDIYNSFGVKLLTRLHLGLSHFNEHKLLYLRRCH